MADWWVITSAYAIGAYLILRFGITWFRNQLLDLEERTKKEISELRYQMMQFVVATTENRVLFCITPPRGGNAAVIIAP